MNIITRRHGKQQVMFFDDEVPTEETNYALCKVFFPN